MNLQYVILKNCNTITQQPFSVYIFNNGSANKIDLTLTSNLTPTLSPKDNPIPNPKPDPNFNPKCAQKM